MKWTSGGTVFYGFLAYGFLAAATLTACSSDSAVNDSQNAAGAGGAAGSSAALAGAGSAGNPVVTPMAGAGGQTAMVTAGAGGALAGAGAGSSAGGAMAGGAGAGGAAGGSAGAGGAGDLASLPEDYEGTPYMGIIQEIPGRIEFEFYDEGGEGIAYHDTDNPNQAKPEAPNLAWDLNDEKCDQNGGGAECELAMFRKDEAIDCSYTKECCDHLGSAEGPLVELGKEYVGWTWTGEWLNYTVDVKEAGTYVARGFFGVNPEAQPTTVTYQIGDAQTETFEMANTSGFHAWKEFEDYFEIELKAGVQLMTLTINTTGQTNFDWIEFVKKP